MKGELCRLWGPCISGATEAGNETTTKDHRVLFLVVMLYSMLAGPLYMERY